jgi:ribosome recycling factor
VKLLGKMAEEARISIRHARREGNDDVKRRLKDGDLSDDEGHRTTDAIQKLTDEYIAKVDELLASKEQEVMTV